MLPINSPPRKRAVSHSSYQLGHPHVHDPLPAPISSSTQPSTPPHSLRRSGSRHPYVSHNTPDRIVSSFASFHNPSPHSSPVTSPSSAHASSSRFTDSRSSFTSESASATVDPRSVFQDSRVPATSHSRFGIPSSQALSGRSRSNTESDLLPIHGGTHKRASKYPSSPRPRTVPNSPSLATLETPESPVAMGIKFLLSKPALPSPTRPSPQSDSGLSSPTRLPTPPKSRPHHPELDGSLFPGCSHPEHPASAINSSFTGPPSISQGSHSLSTNSMPTQGKVHKQRNVLRRKPSAKAKERMQRDLEIKQKLTSASPSHSVHGSVSQEPSLTPANPVAQPHKQRHDRSSVHHIEGPSEVDLRSPSPVPYYTVYGTQSEFRITAGGPEDNRNWSLHAHLLAEQTPQTHHSEPSRSLTRKGSLSRRMSSKWKKTTGGGVKADESPSRDPLNSRSSLQDSRSFYCLKDRGQFKNEGEPAKGHVRSSTDLQGKSEGSKIWKLMKRISTGGLRERFHVDTAAPPVPAIPKELLDTPPRSQTVQRDAQAMSQKSYSASMPRSIVGSGPRPSMATSSSSPNSSEMASASFFHMSHSRGSSVSSYGEETMPGFSSMGDRHIVSPRELHHILDDYTEVQGSMSHSGRPSNSSDGSHSSVRSPSGRATPTAEGKADDQHQETWSRIHTSPITNSIHSLTSLRTRRLGEKPSTPAHAHLLPDGNTSLSPPPRLARDAARSSRSSGSEHSHSRSTFTTATTEGSNSRISLRAPSALSDASTTKMRTRSRSSTSTSKDSSSSQLRSAVNYRELNTPRRPPLTECEKAKIWDDLLERSAQAGGTLHLGGGAELESDNLRFSGYSELSRCTDMIPNDTSAM
ncbi:uncharacterized protein EDB93DRAFT_1169873 [Suillus bovinus]|uniref:uncharacterized protein n=1 Tax=Suillus bovinus TaxID=48563 RepID=UPI001B864645|nr:uncharacterized protein EDB93DRAFT_1169873 [Suillus bovinus]KAG2136080.1 hypothetical protein EDB93DRAFT_1169873 [Suillus bovinus]